MTITALRVETERFGTIEVADGDIIRLVAPPPGFSTLHEAVLLPIDDTGIFVWVQSVSGDDIAFLAVNPFVYHPGYDVQVPTSDAERLDARPADELVVYTLVTIREGAPTTNLAAPLVINARNRRGLQVILEADLPLRAPLDPDLTGGPR